MIFYKKGNRNFDYLLLPADCMHVVIVYHFYLGFGFQTFGFPLGFIWLWSQFCSVS